MSDIKKLSEKEIATSIETKRKALKDFRFGIAGSKVRNVREGRSLRKDIARAKTELNSRTK